MSKKISYRGQLPMGTQERIKLSTKNGKTGYTINRFDIIPNNPGVAGSSNNVNIVAKIFTKTQEGAVSAIVDFTDSELIAVNYYENDQSVALSDGGARIIFDMKVFNQDIFITMEDSTGKTVPCNYYIELKTMELSDIQSTQLTLKSIRTITSR